MHKEYKKCGLRKKTFNPSGIADETVAYIFSEWLKLVGKKYQQVRNDNVAKMPHWNLCEKWRFNKADKWYIHKPEKVLESGNCKILFNFSRQTDNTFEHNRPDTTVIDKKRKKCLLIDSPCPLDNIYRYTGSNRSIRNSNKILWEMDRKKKMRNSFIFFDKKRQIEVCQLYEKKKFFI